MGPIALVDAPELQAFSFHRFPYRARPLVDDPQQSVDAWKLDPSTMPRRLDLELSEELYAALEVLSRRTGRPIRDLVEDLIAQSVTPPLPSCQGGP